MLEAQAARLGSRPFLALPDATLTYAGADELANRVAHGLADLGYGAGDIIMARCGNTEDYELDVEAVFPGPAGREAARATALRAESDRLSHEAKDVAASAVATLRAAGLTYRDIGTLVGVSHQREQQSHRGAFREQRR